MKWQNEQKKGKMFRLLNDCPQCLWKSHEGSKLQLLTSVPVETRLNLHEKVILYFYAVKDEYAQSPSVALAEPEEAGSWAFLA